MERRAFEFLLSLDENSKKRMNLKNISLSDISTKNNRKPHLISNFTPAPRQINDLAADQVYNMTPKQIKDLTPQVLNCI